MIKLFKNSKLIEFYIKPLLQVCFAIYYTEHFKRYCLLSNEITVEIVRPAPLHTRHCAGDYVKSILPRFASVGKTFNLRHILLLSVFVTIIVAISEHDITGVFEWITHVYSAN